MSERSSRIALITGGSRGIGRAAAEQLAARGVGVVITYVANAAAADMVAAGIAAAGGSCAVLRLDVADTTAFDAFVAALRETLRDAWSRTDFDFLVNNAGTGLSRPISETTEAEFDALFAVHLKGAFFLTQKLLPLIADDGRIVNLSSGLTRFALPGSAAYAMMKGAVEVFTRYLAKELGSRGIAANTLAPGPVETDFNHGGVRDNPEVKARIAGMTALGRAGLPEDIGGLIVSLLADENRWINAQRIEASGGMLI